MSPRKKTEEVVHLPEISLWHPHETKAQSPELQRPDSTGLNISEDRATAKVPLKREDFPTSSVSFKSDELKDSVDFKERLSSVRADLQNDLNRLNDADEGVLVESPRRLVSLKSEDSPASVKSFKSDRSKDDIIDFKERGIPLRLDLPSSSEEEDVGADNGDLIRSSCHPVRRKLQDSFVSSHSPGSVRETKKETTQDLKVSQKRKSDSSHGGVSAKKRLSRAALQTVENTHLHWNNTDGSDLVQSSDL